MRNHLAALCAGLALCTTAMKAQTITIEEKNKVGAVEFISSNCGTFGVDTRNGLAGFFYPRESDRSYMFGSGLWFGAVKMVSGEAKQLTFITYNMKSGTGWGTPGEYRAVPHGASPLIYNSTEYDRASGKCLIPDRRPNWPLWLAPGTTAIPRIPGIFEPVDSARTSENGQYSRPAFIAGADEQIVSRFHDGNLDAYEVRDSALNGFPIGLQIQQNILAWEDGNYAPAVLIQYQIVNVSGETLHDCVVGQATDPDIGLTVENDRARYYSERPDLRTGYIWDESAINAYGALAIALIEAPVTDDSGFIDITNRTSYRTEGRVGAFPEWTIERDPVGSSERYALMTDERFANNFGPGDQRAMLASTKFSMHPGDTAYFTIAYAVVDSVPLAGKVTRDKEGRAMAGINMSQLEEIVTRLTDDYYSEYGFKKIEASAPTLPAEMNDATLMVSPNPAQDRTTLHLNLARSADATLRITNSLGQTMLVRKLGLRPAGPHNETIDTSILPAGIYFALVEAAGRTAVTRLVVAR